MIEVSVTITRKGKSFSGWMRTNAMLEEKEAKRRLDLAARAIRDQIIRMVTYASTERIQKMVNHPLAPTIILLSMGSHERARDERIKKAQHERGMRFEFINNILPDYGTRGELRIMSPYYEWYLPPPPRTLIHPPAPNEPIEKAIILKEAREEFEWVYPFRIDEEFVQKINNEMITRASSLEVEEEMVRHMLPRAIEVFEG